MVEYHKILFDQGNYFQILFNLWTLKSSKIIDESVANVQICNFEAIFFSEKKSAAIAVNPSSAKNSIEDLSIIILNFKSELSISLWAFHGSWQNLGNRFFLHAIDTK